MKTQPRDADGRRKLKECENALRKQRFEEAIMTPEVAVVRISILFASLSPFFNHDTKILNVNVFYSNRANKQVKVSDSINVKEMAVDASYEGPRLEEDCIVTKEFVTNMVEHFKQSKTIHSRCAQD